jgi:hypothetical protein
MRHSIFLFVIVFLVASCEQSEETNQKPDLTIAPQFLEPIYFGVCFGGLCPPTAREIVIKSNREYQNLGDSCRILTLSSVRCSEATLPDIDFKHFSLIGIFTSGGGCSAEYGRSLEVDTITKVYHYAVQATYEGDCDMLLMNMNWALVPAIPDDYSVVFEE